MSPAVSGARLSLADQVLANMVGFLSAQRIEDERTALAIEIAGEALPHINRNITPMVALSEAAGELLTAWPDRNTASGSVRWCQAHLTASDAVAGFLFWRASMAVDAWRASLAPKEDAA